MSNDRKQKGKRYLTVLFLSAVLCAGILCAGGRSAENELQQAEASAGSGGNDTVLLGGMPVGIYMETDGVMVLSTESLERVDGEVCEPAEGLVKSGDYITAVNKRANQSFWKQSRTLTAAAWCSR